jgi:heptosyltransferase-2/heptosyltransferase-3
MRFPPSPAAPFTPHNLLLIRPDHIGDVLFTTPALHALRATFPETRITALVGPWAATILERNPDVDVVLRCPFPWFDRRPKPSLWQPYRVLLREAGQIRALAFDAVLVLRFDHWWGALLAAWADIPVRLGYATPETTPFLSTALPYAPHRHAVEHNLDLARALAEMAGRPLSATEDRLRFPLTPDERAFAEAFLARHDLAQDTPLIGLHPGAGDPQKLWPPHRWAQVADHLAEFRDARILITGSAAERELAEEIARHMKHTPLLAAGQTTLGQAAALLARCQLVVGADTGPMHLAVALGVPTVHLFGPFEPTLFGPWGDPTRHRIVRAPSGRMADITVDQVTAAAIESLNRGPECASSC